MNYVPTRAMVRNFVITSWISFLKILTANPQERIRNGSVILVTLGQAQMSRRNGLVYSALRRVVTLWRYIWPFIIIRYTVFRIAKDRKPHGEKPSFAASFAVCSRRLVITSYPRLWNPQERTTSPGLEEVQQPFIVRPLRGRCYIFVAFRRLRFAPPAVKNRSTSSTPWFCRFTRSCGLQICGNVTGTEIPFYLSSVICQFPT